MTWQEISITVPFEYVEPISYLFDRYVPGMAMEVLGVHRVIRGGAGPAPRVNHPGRRETRPGRRPGRDRGDRRR